MKNTYPQVVVTQDGMLNGFQGYIETFSGKRDGKVAVRVSTWYGQTTLVWLATSEYKEVK